jgi:hypothetical protein
MKKIIAVLGFMAFGAAVWAAFGDQITDKAVGVKDEVQTEVHNKTQSVADSIKP